MTDNNVNVCTYSFIVSHKGGMTSALLEYQAIFLIYPLYTAAFWKLSIFDYIFQSNILVVWDAKRLEPRPGPTYKWNTILAPACLNIHKNTDKSVSPKGIKWVIAASDLVTYFSHFFSYGFINRLQLKKLKFWNLQISQSLLLYQWQIKPRVKFDILTFHPRLWAK